MQYITTYVSQTVMDEYCCPGYEQVADKCLRMYIFNLVPSASSFLNAKSDLVRFSEKERRSAGDEVGI